MSDHVLLGNNRVSLVSKEVIMRPHARANLRANTNRGNVHCKQNCFRGVLLFKTFFAEFGVKSGRKTEPWNWAVIRK